MDWAYTIQGSSQKFVFPAWANYMLPAILVVGVGVGVYVPTLVGYALNPTTLNVGYAPVQPVPFSHAIHAGRLGMDCRYCHTTVETSGFAAIPPTQTCMNCHNTIHKDKVTLAPLRESHATGKPMGWKKVHDLGDYSYFNHSVHVNKGVGCVTCHGRVDTMDVVRQSKNLSMSWCVECHRNPEQYLRPRDQITNMTWDSQVDAGEPQLALGMALKTKYGVHDAAYMTSCSRCHR